MVKPGTLAQAAREIQILHFFTRNISVKMKNEKGTGGILRSKCIAVNLWILIFLFYTFTLIYYQGHGAVLKQ
jgi:hypothetical protein